MRKRGFGKDFTKNFTKGFTLAEVMIVLVVLGVLAAILIPVIVKLKPDRTKIMFKKGYYIAERVVNELVNNETYYGDIDATNPFFTDELDTVPKINGVNVSGLTKFCQLFASKVNTTTAPVCTAAASNITTGSGNFTTNDGITWWLPTDAAAGGYTTVFANGNATVTPPVTSYQRPIYLDINGIATAPNCFYVSATVCPNPDRFTITVQFDGKLLVSGTKEQLYLRDMTIQ